MDRSDVRDFFRLHGVVESACMCLALACGVPSGPGGEDRAGMGVRDISTDNSNGAMRYRTVR